VDARAADADKHAEIPTGPSRICKVSNALQRTAGTDVCCACSRNMSCLIRA
jgi:hypothetical protein